LVEGRKFWGDFLEIVAMTARQNVRLRLVRGDLHKDFPLKTLLFRKYLAVVIVVVLIYAREGLTSISDLYPIASQGHEDVLSLGFII
jgi:hypothetical protein